MVVAAVSSGILIGKVGYYTPFLIGGICINAIGAGLLNTLSIGTTIQRLIGFQILYGFGLGASMPGVNLAAQTVLPRDEVSIGVSLMFFGQTLFGAIFVSIGQNLLDGRLAQGLQGMINVTPQEIEGAGATGLLDIIPSSQHTEALRVYNSALRLCFQVAVIMSCVAIVGALTMEWRSVKGPKKAVGADAEAQDGRASSDAAKVDGEVTDDKEMQK